MDLPEVSLVAILDADREGYLRSYRSLIQIMGRAARNINSKILLYADELTDSIKIAVNETKRRREKQISFNKEHNITPVSITKDISDLLPPELSAAYEKERGEKSQGRGKNKKTAPQMTVQELEREMWEAVERLDFERAAVLRDTIKSLQ